MQTVHRVAGDVRSGDTRISRNERSERRMRDLNPRDFHLRVFETRALGRYANPPSESYGDWPCFTKFLPYEFSFFIKSESLILNLLIRPTIRLPPFEKYRRSK